MNIEIWKLIENFSKYEISSFGNIKNKLTTNKIKSSIKSGYYCTSLTSDDGTRKSIKNHRIVAINFIENLENKETVNHKDHNKLNNNINNLEWATTTEQNQHKRKCKKEIQELVSSRSVWRVDKDSNEKIEKYQTIKLAAKYIFDNKLTSIKEFDNGNNIKTKICAVCRGKRNTAYEYKWIYDDSNENMFDNEIWKNIPKELINNIDEYKISNYGRLKNHKGKISEGYLHSSGYLWISISPKQYLLHRLVAKVFILNPENKDQVNHKDGNKQNAKVDNLEWMTNKQNSQHAHDNGLHLNTKKIIQYDLTMKKIKEFNSQTYASKELNINSRIISNCCLNKIKQVNGFIFKFSEK